MSERMSGSAASAPLLPSTGEAGLLQRSAICNVKFDQKMFLMGCKDAASVAAATLLL